ncbi:MULTISPECIES: chemotaxis protein CheW [unclassified Leptolyngbya]|uniref:chemotaxis protein CheW n=1 Tax=unclassified Leptolyngbya TaxID=2650499 RepID=UPI001689E2B9|nr:MULTISPECIES: chemotaxis protein CheW [unclassified Leptolyngbya]MBD1909424.1 chemotaxis protein CheW [Leptolyngbya sp. FACHB-8]MBD2158588.1 chemotaxis protein CheW [Leptolyngbya sp. FACHB-16]
MVDSAIALPNHPLSHEPAAGAPESSATSLARAQWVDLETIAQHLNQHFGSQGITVQARWKENYLVLLIESLALPEVDILLPQVQQALEVLKLKAVEIVHVYARITGEANPLWGRRITLNPLGELQVPTQSVAPTTRSVADWLAQGAGVSSQILAPVIHQAAEERRFLRCCLSTEESVLIPLVEIQSIFTTRLANIVPVPHMPDTVLGVHHYRGEMLWMVDLDAQLGLGASEGQEQELTAIVIQHQASAIGFVTHAQVEIETQSSDQIHGLDGALFPSRLTPYLSGYLQESGTPVLNVSALLNQR